MGTKNPATPTEIQALPLERPSPAQGALGRIGISMSGGGYRAAAFHLGTLSLLNDLGLLEDVRGISTVSGGTLVGMRWALGLARGEPFSDFYGSFCAFLAVNDCVELALERMGAERKTLSRRKSLITATADVYASDAFLGQSKFAELLDTKTQLEELTFNTTEFQSGLDFRFIKSRYSAFCGNGPIRLSRQNARPIRLADITAASSCFPGGFEPIEFPADFVWDDGDKGESSLVPSGLALMDGGIFDNTGLDALLLAQNRGADYQEICFDTLILSDVDQDSELMAYSADPKHVARDSAFFRFDSSREATKSGPSFGLLRNVIRFLGALSAISSLMLISDLFSAQPHILWRQGLTGLAAATMACVSLLPILVERWAAEHIRGRFSPDAKKLWSYLRGQSLSSASELLELRIKSLLAMTTDVFMKRVRSLQLDLAYADASIRPRLVSNFIYTLVAADKARKASKLPAEDLAPSRSQVLTAEQAHAMPTTLWFDNPLQLETLISAGRSATSFNLLKHIRSLRPSARNPQALDELERKILALWLELGKKPVPSVAPGLSNGSGDIAA